ncbi:kinase-like domain-containing protein [Podospora australis]|uniref:Kinase-like domain-containing protein n=1 Tax=Podospora australis TaxID=1536484 RepID=A0AAN7AMU4_9PEZI|nr:kinase-like domain-containing protein [Podospora australis]
MSAPSPAPSAQQLPPPRRSAMKNDGESSERPTPPLSASIKAVHIAEPESSSASLDEASVKKQFPANIAKRLSGRPSISSNTPSRASTISQISLDGIGDSAPATGAPSAADAEDSQNVPSYHRHRIDRVSEKLVSQVAEWLHREKAKKESRKSRKVSKHRKSPPPESPDLNVSRPRAGSVDSDSSEVSLDRLQRIINDSMSALGISSVPHLGPPRLSKKHRKRSSRSLRGAASSDTEFFDGDILVPSCDGFLDNSKTLSYTGGKADVNDAASISGRREEKEKQAWLTFKNEIIRLAHTLRLKGWRRVPLDSGESISVERLSGALTNAVYVVSPPPESVLPPQEGKKSPEKVLLRIYGPQVEHLIDRENELSVLRRLARKKIGPRLLGTFMNGRFEQYLNAAALTSQSMREPDISRHIAKRMRELHDGVELLDEEKDQGPGVWRNWDKWLTQVEKTVLFLDKQVQPGTHGIARSSSDKWKARGYVCGVEWSVFKELVQKYRKLLDDHYGHPKNIRDKLVFAHNDTQYGNILRVRPDDKKSPLLQPANEHKQLVVIDFEYAGANIPGLEFANHFSEWTYNYHDPVYAHACDTTKYPNPEQQRRFIKAYVDHRSQYPYVETPRGTPGGTPTGTPLPTAGSTSSIVDFMLDARVPSGGWKEEERKREEASEKRIKELLEETKLWRTANSAQWVAWGIVQAKIPGLKLVPAAGGEENGQSEEESEEDADAFDYLGYTQERAYFFLGDCVQLGLIKMEELPEGVRKLVKIVEY